MRSRPLKSGRMMPPAWRNSFKEAMDMRWLSLIFIRIPLIFPLWLVGWIADRCAKGCEIAIYWIDQYAPAPKRPKWLR